ncbi:MAG: ester cyclase [Cyclobacteriaceae bacterium]|nr:ester cyclase [Cyclobacteriaceae bacterium]
MSTSIQEKKEIVIRFNKEVIEKGSMSSFNQLVSEKVINHSAPPGTPQGPESMIYFLFHMLRAGFPDLKVEILDQVAEGDLVTTRKKIHATHLGEFFGIAPTRKPVVIDIIDIIRIKDGKYAEHWGISNISDVVAELAK